MSTQQPETPAEPDGPSTTQAPQSTEGAPPSTLVLLVRHGATPTTGQLLPGRAPGLQLSEQGRAQAQRAAERIAALEVDAVYASPLERTVQTAQATAERTGVPVTEETGLLECEVGDWTGARLTDLVKLPEWRTVQNEPDTFTFPNGESFTEMQDRMVRTVKRIRREHLGATLALFSHADPIRAVLAHYLSIPLKRFQRLSVGPCSISAVSFQHGRDPVVLTVNSTQDPLSDLTAS